jgi:telomerase reverse transcriptase
MKYIFPKQFGLHNVFTHVTDRRETTHAFKDYTDRENEITGAMKGRDEKVYRRLGLRILPLITKMQKMHKSCSYDAIIHYYCTSASEYTYDAELEASFDEEKEGSKEITQMELPTVSTITSDDAEVTSQECDIIRHHTPHNKVSKSYA